MYSNATETISSELLKVDEKIFEILSQNKNFLTQNFLEYILTGSKKIRSTVAILVSKAYKDSFSDRQATVCAISEIIHNASLIHDDIIDNSELRRGNRSFNSTFGNSVAVLSGDYLISIVLNELLKLNNNEVLIQYANTFSMLCNGEINQLGEKNQIISVEKYLEKTEKKTAELFKTTLFSTFLIENQQENLNFAKNFGKNFGIAFQIRDDILDITQKSAGKPVLADFKNGICTLPVIFFAKEKNINDIKKINLSELKNSCAISKSADLCAKYVNSALDLLGHFSDNQYAETLKNLCEELKRI